ncbi:MAG: hypothetical protein L0Z50_35780, partial [Verrucomicrobiales bacterium]|nr:hypothetical protein [Verrucomicrobiales bacterium]
MSTTTDTSHEGTATTRKRNGKASRPSPVLDPAAGPALDVQRLLLALVAARNGDFSVRLPAEWTGIYGRIADAFNEILASNETMAKELDRVSRVVGKEGKIQQRANFKGTGGAWRGMEDSINTLIGDLVWPTTEVTRTIGAIAKGDLSQTMTLEVDGRPLEGEFLRSAKIVNSMIGQLSV